MNCCRDFTVEIADEPPFSCGANPAAVQDAVWTQSPNTPAGCSNSSFAGGSGTWDFEAHLAPSVCIGGLWVTAPICNPGSAYNITVTIPWDDSGSISGAGSTTITFSLVIDVVEVASVTRSLLTGPFTPIVLVGSLPGFQTSVVEIKAITTAIPSPTYNVFSNGATTITPLTPP
jgi:hypothetical protein